MAEEVLSGFRPFLSITDPRDARGRRHRLVDVIVIALCGALCGVDNAEELQAFGEAKQAWFETFLDLPHGIPSQDTFLRVFAALDPDEFRAAFIEWVEALRRPVDYPVIAIDGKSLRRSFSAAEGKLRVHMVSAYLTDAGLVLASLKTPSKTNEINAIPQLLEFLDLRGATVTTDAMGCQRKIAETIRSKGGDYMLQVAENHPTLRADLALHFDALDVNSPHVSVHSTIDKGHGRIEERTYIHCTDTEWFTERGRWLDLGSFAAVMSRRTDLTTNESSLEWRYYISSHADPDAARAGAAIRGHWGIENGLHWTLDMAFDEDQARVRTGNAAENFAMVRHTAINLLKNEKTKKGGVKTRRKRCGWDEDYLLLVMGVRSAPG